MVSWEHRNIWVAALGVMLLAFLAGCSSHNGDLGLENEEIFQASQASLVYSAAPSPAVNALGNSLQPLHDSVVGGVIRVLTDAQHHFNETTFVFEGSSTPLDIDRSLPDVLILDTMTLSDGSYTLLALTSKGRSKHVREIARATFTVNNETADDVGDVAADNEVVKELPRPPEYTDGIVIHPQDDATEIINMHPAGTVFVFASGVHRLTSPIIARNNDVFFGQEGAVLSGAKPLTSFTREAGLWVAEDQTQQGDRQDGWCLPESPRCLYPENLFFDDLPLEHVDSKTKVVAGAWHFDYDANKIYFADDPRGKLVETGVTKAAISGDARGVTVSGLVIEKFANHAQYGAIHTLSANHSGEDWLIERNTVKLNHGVGIRVSSGARVINNHVVHNGQLGIAAGGSDVLIDGNTIAFNNFAGFHDGWEAGGTKFAYTTDLVVRNNHVHNNRGPGLWTDIDNVGTLYEQNLVEHNTNSGIWHEISYSAVIRHNTVRDNGYGLVDHYPYVFGAGILVHNSSGVEIYGNTVIGNRNGITGVHQDRGTGKHGPWELKGLYVHDNIIEMAYYPDVMGPQGYRGFLATSGVAQDMGFTQVFDETYNNRFENNTYLVNEEHSEYFRWLNKGRSFTVWQTCGGQESLWSSCRQDSSSQLVRSSEQHLAGF